MKHHAKTNYFQVSLDNYDVLLSYPNSSKPNKVNFSNKLLTNPNWTQICIILIALIKPTSSKQNSPSTKPGSCSDLNVFISGRGPPCVFCNHKPSLKLSSTWNWHPESVIQTAEETATKLVIQEILALFLDPTSHYYSYLRCIWWIWIVRWGLPVVTRKTSSGGIDVDEAMNWKRRHFVKVNHVHYVLGSRLQDEHPEFIHAFNAYTPPGDVTGDLVFVPSP